MTDCSQSGFVARYLSPGMILYYHCLLGERPARHYEVMQSINSSSGKTVYRDRRAPGSAGLWVAYEEGYVLVTNIPPSQGLLLVDYSRLDSIVVLYGEKLVRIPNSFLKLDVEGDYNNIRYGEWACVTDFGYRCQGEPRRGDHFPREHYTLSGEEADE